MSYIRTRTVIVRQGDELYDWCCTICTKGNNLKNAVRYRQRQVLTARKKNEADLTDNEREVVEEIRRVMGVDVLTSNQVINYSFLYHLLQDSRNPDYFAEGLPRQSAQHIIKQAAEDMDSFYKAVAAWKRDPSKFTGKPELPGYARKGGYSTVPLSNQDCTAKADDNGDTLIKLPYMRNFRLNIGVTEGRLKEAKVVPDNGAFKLMFSFEIDAPEPVYKKTDRVAGVDFGVDNLMAVTNNIGKPCILYKGGIIKSCNQFYNKRLAEIMSEEMTKPDCPKAKDGKPKFVPTDESMALTLERECRIKDFMFKTAESFITWCVENRIDTIVLGVNKGWKQEVELGKTNNQNFVQIPFATLRFIISYKASEYGIKVIEQEESYTSKASFPDGDDIPVYGEEKETPKFSGRRRPTHYKGMYKKDGFRGLYKTKDGTIINSDLNASANILRKALPDAFARGKMPDFNTVLIIRDPDGEFVNANKKEQLNKKRKTMSQSKRNRLIRKTA